MCEKLSSGAYEGLSYCFLSAYDEIEANIKFVCGLSDEGYKKLHLRILSKNVVSIKIAVKELGFDVLSDRFDQLDERCKSIISKLN